MNEIDETLKNIVPAFLFGPETIRERLIYLGVALMPDGTLHWDSDIPEKSTVHALVKHIAPLCLNFDLQGVFDDGKALNKWTLAEGKVHYSVTPI